MDNYIPPEPTSIPFTFTDRGYIPPDPTDITFNFTPTVVHSLLSTISADLNVMGLYHESAYTYLKGRQKYIVGYEEPGKVKIVYGRDLFGGIRDLRSFAKGVYTSHGDLSSYILPESFHKDLEFYVKVGQLYYDYAYTYVKQCKDYVIGYGPDGIQVISAPCLYGGIRDLRYFAKGVYSYHSDVYFSISGEYLKIDELSSNIYGHHPSNLLASIRTGFTDAHYDLPVDIDVTLYKGTHNLKFYSAHNYPIEVKFNIKGIGKGYNDLIFDSLGIKKSSDDYLYSNIGIDVPSSVGASLRPWYVEVPFDLPSYLLTEWFKDDKDIYSYIYSETPVDIRFNIRGWFRKYPQDLNTTLNGVLFRDLIDIGFYVFVNAVDPLRANLKPVHKVQEDISSYIDGSLFRTIINVPAFIGGHEPEHLKFNIRPLHKEYNNLYADMFGYIRSGDIGLGGFIGAHIPEMLTATIRMWHKGYKDLGIAATGELRKDDSYIYSYIGTETPLDLLFNIKSVHKAYADLLSYVGGELKKDQGGLVGFIASDYPLNVLANIRGIFKGYEDILFNVIGIRSTLRWLDASISVGYPEDISSTIRPLYSIYEDIWFDSIGILKRGINNLPSVIDTHLPKDLNIPIRAWHREVFYDLNVIASGSYLSDDKPLYSSINSFFSPYIRAEITAWQRERVRDLNTFAEAVWFKGDSPLPIYIGGEHPVSVRAEITAWQRLKQRDLNTFAEAVWFKGESDIPTYMGGIVSPNLGGAIRMWYKRERDLVLSLWAHPPIYLYVDISVHGPIDLESYLSVHFPENLISNIKPVYSIYRNLNTYLIGELNKGTGYLEAYIGTELPVDLSSTLRVFRKGYLDFYFDLIGELKKGDKNLTGAVSMLPPVDLGTDIKTHPPVWLFMDVYVRPPVDIGSYITGVPTVQLSGKIFSEQPRNIFFSIKPFHRGDKLLLTYLLPIPPKDIETYIGGHLPSTLNSSLIGLVIRNIKASIRPSYLGDVPLTFDIVGSLVMGIDDLYMYGSAHLPTHIYSSIHTHNPVDIYFNIETILPKDISSHIGTSFPVDIASYIAYHLPIDLMSQVYGWDEKYLCSNINSFFAHPHDIGSYIRAFQYKELPVSMYGWQDLNIGSTISYHEPVNLDTYLNTYQREVENIAGSLYGWQDLNLGFIMEGAVYGRSLSSFLKTDLPRDIGAFLRIWPSTDLGTSLHSWDLKDISGYMYFIYTKPLDVSIGGHIYRDLGFRVSGSGFIGKDLTAFARVFQWIPLSADLFTFDTSALNSYLFPIVSRNIKIHIHGWEERFLSFYLDGREYPWNLTASITAYGNYYILKASLKSVKEHLANYDLPGYLESYEYRDLNYFIYPISGFDLPVFIEADMGAKNLRAYIRPDMVRMTKIVGITTMELKDLTAMINVSCFASSFSFITAYIKSIYLSNLGFTLFGKEYTREHTNLSVDIGYNYTYIVQNKIPISIQVLSDYIMIMNRLPIGIQILGGYRHLTSSLMGVPIEKNIGASIRGMYVPDYRFPLSKHRVRQYKISPWTNKAQLHQVIEITFKEAVVEYTYMSHSEKVYSNNTLDIWVGKLRSFFPENIALGLKRRLNRYRQLDALNNYKNLDNLVKDIIVYLTRENTNNISASVNLEGGSMSINLSAGMTIRRTRSTQGDLLSSIMPNPPILYVKYNDSVYKTSKYS